MSGLPLQIASPETPIYARAHACEDTVITDHGKSFTCGRACEEQKKHVPPYARARVSVISSRVGIDDLPEIFRFSALHEHQRQTIQAAAAGRDVILNSATGSGKLEALVGTGLVRGELTLIVSPLRSLIADQTRRLEALGIPVRAWNSDVSDGVKEEILQDLRGDWCGFLITTPESLAGRELSRHLVGRVNTAAIDEAHCCLRERAFRVSYGRLGATLDRIRPSIRVACTATLSVRDRAKLSRSLRMDDPVEIVLPVARSNLAIKIVERDRSVLASIMNGHRGQTGIVFCATVRTADKLHAEMRSQGRAVTLYHGRLKPKEKVASQRAFMSGECPVAIVTDAFLLGIDKADVRFTAHYDYPKSIDDWVQGFGRAGRDGLSSGVFGCFEGATQGKDSRRFLIGATYPPVDELERVWQYLIAAPFRDETPSTIGQNAIGGDGKYRGQAALASLQRHDLAAADKHPEDGRKRLYRGCGDFASTDWLRYVRERADAFARFNQLCDLVALPDAEIPAAIDEYFER